MNRKSIFENQEISRMQVLCDIKMEEMKWFGIRSLLFLGMLLSALPVFSQDQEEFRHVVPGNGTRICSPYFFVKSNDPVTSWMPLHSTRADVQITGVIANVRIEQVYINKSRQKDKSNSVNIKEMPAERLLLKAERCRGIFCNRSP